VPRGGVMTWNHVRDVVTAHVNAVEHGKSGFNYLLGGVESDWAEYLETAAGVMGLPVEIQRWPLWALNIVTRLIMVVDRIRGQVPSATPQLMRFLNGVYRCDSEPACRDLGFEFTPLEEMVRHSYEWMVDEHFLEPPRTAGALASGGSGPS
jgi:dihydroflavonol-4-reductase